jgi:hypothetical protein|tara:strand:+ start:626 stop:907 length:282 start_codon:yes stop_codon:yes gene_type:complete
MIQELLAQDSPVAVVRGLGIYSLTFNGKECFPILVLDCSMARELHKYVGGGSTLNESLEIAVDYIEYVTKYGIYATDNMAKPVPQWNPPTHAG